MYKSKFLQNVLGEHSSKGSKVGFEDFEDTMPKGFSEKAKTKLTHPDSKKFLQKLQKPESPPDVIKLQTYFGMSPYPCTEQQRLELFWSILGECIEERKQFIFQCENEQEADELKKLTYTLVFQINDIWEVYLDDLVVKANPPRSNAVPNTY